MRALLTMRFGAMVPVAAVLLVITQLPLAAGPAGAVNTCVTLVGLAWVLVGMRRHRPEGRLWRLVAASAILNVVATGIYHAPAYLHGAELPGTPTVSDPLWIAGDLLVAGALVCALVDRERPQPVLLDVVTLAAGVGLIAGVMLVGPDIAASHLSPAGAATAALYAIGDVVVFSAVLRLLMTPSARSPSLWLLAAAATAVVTSDVLWNWLTIASRYEPGGWAEAGWRLLPLLCGLAALHPSMRTLRRGDRRHRDDLALTTPLLLGAASLVAPVLLGLHALFPMVPPGLDRTTNAVAVLMTGAVISCLVVTRFIELLRHARGLAQRAESALVERSRMLRFSEARRRSLIEHLPAVILGYELDADNRPSRPVYVGGQIEAIMGMAAADWEHDDASFMERIHPEDRPACLASITEAAAGRDVRPVEYRFLRPDGREIWLRGAGSVIGETDGPPVLQAVLVDISEIKAADAEREALERELRLSQRLEAVGQLAAGIAHEINTPVQFVGDTVRFLEEAFTDVMAVTDAHGELRRAAEAGTVDARLLERVREAEEDADLAYLSERVPGALARADDGIRQVATIVRAIRAFAHPEAAERAPVDLNDAVRNTLVVARNTYKLVADVETDLGDVPPVIGNGGEINQALLNLVVNAAHAIEDAVGDSGGRGTIRIASRREGESVTLRISDTGGGIPAEIAPRIFDPFFTTKEVGRGTGQGLVLTRTMVVERHGGSLTFESEPGAGTTFVVRLPIEQASQTEAPEVPA